MSERSPEGLLSRWSRLKQEAAREAKKPEAEPTGDEAVLAGGVIDTASDTASAESPSPPAPVLTDEDMPPLDSLDSSSDYAGFMSPGVSEGLRKLALKKLFSAPTFNLRDGLDDYDDDFTSFEKLGDIVTSDMKHQLEMEARKKLEREAEQMLQSQRDGESLEAEALEQPALDSRAEVVEAGADDLDESPIDEPTTEESILNNE